MIKEQELEETKISNESDEDSKEIPEKIEQKDEYGATKALRDAIN